MQYIFHFEKLEMNVHANRGKVRVIVNEAKDYRAIEIKEFKNNFFLLGAAINEYSD